VHPTAAVAPIDRTIIRIRFFIGFYPVKADFTTGELGLRPGPL
jgi:hypothetical protein